MRLRRLEPVLRRALRGPCSLEPGSRLLVAVSGGADSTALLVGLARIAPEFGLELRAAHLHHGLRGADADGDLAFVRDLCARLSVPLGAARRDTRALMRRRGLAGQAGLRTLRREFLCAVARRSGAAVVATAHTADDQLETLLLRLGRGTGLRGLGGMAPRHGLWIKPLLEATREDVEADLTRAGQAWREDRSNRDPHYARNRIRHEVLPVWSRALGHEDATTRAGISTLARHAVRIAAEARGAQSALGARAARLLTRHARRGEGRIELEAAAVARSHEAVRGALILALWRSVAPAGLGLPGPQRSALERLLGGPNRRARVSLPGGCNGMREGGVFRLTRGPSNPAPAHRRGVPTRSLSPRSRNPGALAPPSGKGPFLFGVPAELSWGTRAASRRLGKGTDGSTRDGRQAALPRVPRRRNLAVRPPGANRPGR